MPSSKTSTTKYDTGPWKAMTGPITNEALPALREGYNYATTGPGGQLLNDTTGFARDTLGGRYLDLANNPYLQNAMQTAGREAQTYFDVLGARSGRGSRGEDFAGAMAGATEEARMKPLLALYEAERGRQQQMAGMTPALQMAGMAPSMALSDAYRGFGALGKSGTETTKETSTNPMGMAMTALSLLSAPFTGGASLGLLGGGLAGMGLGAGTASAINAGLSVGAGLSSLASAVPWR